MLAVLTLLLCAAPLPAKKPVPRVPAAHVCRCWWGTDAPREYEMTFHKDGRYSYRNVGDDGKLTSGVYLGRWSQEGLTLHVEEYGVAAEGDESAVRCRWSVGPGCAVIAGRPDCVILLMPAGSK